MDIIDLSTRRAIKDDERSREQRINNNFNVAQQASEILRGLMNARYVLIIKDELQDIPHGVMNQTPYASAELAIEFANAVKRS